jgi:hypothetical protein
MSLQQVADNSRASLPISNNSLKSFPLSLFLSLYTLLTDQRIGGNAAGPTLNEILWARVHWHAHNSHNGWAINSEVDHVYQKEIPGRKTNFPVTTPNLVYICFALFPLAIFHSEPTLLCKSAAAATTRACVCVISLENVTEREGRFFVCLFCRTAILERRCGGSDLSTGGRTSPQTATESAPTAISRLRGRQD